MKKRLKIIALILLIAFVGIQFIPTELNQSSTISKAEFTVVNEVPKLIDNTLKVSCYDCHSDNTNYPWYNKVQPMSWFLEGHITEGKAELNFSEWGEYSNRRKKSKLKSIISQINDNEMPLSSYTLIHQEAKLTKKDKEIVITWINQMIDSL